MGAAALQRYIASLGGIGTPGVGSSSSYSPKDLNKEIMPEKVNLFSSGFTSIPFFFLSFTCNNDINLIKVLVKYKDFFFFFLRNGSYF